MQQSFALQVFNTYPALMPHARKLWPCPADREDGLSEMLMKAIKASHRFDGSNLLGWLKVILQNIKRDQSAKGFAKMGTAAERAARRADGPRVSYVDPHEGYADHLADLCDPEAILIAQESFRAPFH